VLLVPEIRLAKAYDAGVIAEMSRSYIEQGLGWSWREQRVLNAIRDRSTNVAVMGGDDGIVGFGIMQYRDETAHLTLFAIRPTHRNRGLGSVLVGWLEKPALIAGMERIRVEARADNQKAVGFYERLGFKPVKTVPGYYSGMVDAVQLEKRLSGADPC
jgi:ribosomal-protein-alanine N-acetyltransferase